ncbi:MAG: N-acetylmuramoyl-L-alanine amidase [Deltaproteobacteria bacterium]|nr:N-acetylmuramoyl-L-alanine amidase [Deltaproteobacteria bacterium]
MICSSLFRRHALISVFISLFFALSFPSPAYATSSSSSHSAARLFKRSQDCSKALYRSSTKRKYRHNWERCIARYKSVYQGFPHTDEAVWAMYKAGNLWTDLSRYSGRESDLDRAITLYRDLVKKYKEHRLADDAQYKLGEIYYTRKKDPRQAYVEFLKVEVKFPKGDMRARASTMLNKLERILGKKRAAREKKKTRAEVKLQQMVLVKDIRHWSTPTYTRVVIDLKDQVKYKGHLLKKDPDLKKPRRLYVDLRNAWINKEIETSIPIKDELLRRARAGQYKKDTVRVVLDIDNMVGYKIFHLFDPFRIVIDVQGEERKPAEVVIAKTTPEEEKEEGKTQKELSLAKQLGLGVRRIVIDAGHGGKDPGAVGRNGIREKDIVLKLAGILAGKVREELHCQPVLTRTTDVFLPLEKRTAIANIKKADLFISLHVNAHKYSKVQGLETYFLNIALDEDSMNLAARENATSTKNISDLQVILNDLMLNTKINESSRLAEFVHRGLLGAVRGGYKHVQNRGVRQAPFYVLIGAEMPAVLVEIGYITNPLENKRLRSETYLRRVASGIVQGIRSYIRDMEATYKGG